MNYVSDRAIVKGYVSPFTLILGPSIIDEYSIVDSNVIIGYPERGKIMNLLRQGFESRNLISILDNLSSGSRVGSKVIIRAGVTIYENTEISSNVEFGHNVLVREFSKISENSRIGSSTVIDGYVSIGRNVNIQSNVYISKGTIIEDEVFIGPGVIIMNDKYPPSSKLRPVTIKKGAVIGAGALIMAGVTIGEYSIIGAGALITRDVEAESVVYGLPARKVYNLREYLRKREYYLKDL